VIYTAHGFHFHKNGSSVKNLIFARAERLAAAWTHALLTINAEDAEQASQFKLAPGGFHVRLPGAGIDIDRFNPARFDSSECRLNLASSLAVGNRARFVLMVAEFSPGKRHRDALKAFAELRYPDAHLILAGAGGEENRMKKLTRRLGLENCVHFLGYRRDIPELLAASDVAILPSEREGLPVGVIEAMAMERPVVVASARGSSDLVNDGCGWVHPIGDFGALALLMRKVLNSPREAAVRAHNARKKVLSQYSWRAVRQDLINVYERLGVKTARVCSVGSADASS
jgi:glycosyltransferase involved in cell wall biosynthesis